MKNRYFLLLLLESGGLRKTLLGHQVLIIDPVREPEDMAKSFANCTNY